MNIKLFISKLPHMLVYYATGKQCYICDNCRKIHSRSESDAVINNKYGLFVSKECFDKACRRALEKTSENLRNKINENFTKNLNQM